MTRDTITLYRLLAQALTYPNQDFIASLKTAFGKINIEVFDDPSLPLSSFVQAFSELATLPLNQIQGEHTRLFISAYPHVPCPPYESAYREGELMGEAT